MPRAVTLSVFFGIRTEADQVIYTSSADSTQIIKALAQIIAEISSC